MCRHSSFHARDGREVVGSQGVSGDTAIEQGMKEKKPGIHRKGRRNLSESLELELRANLVFAQYDYSNQKHPSSDALDLLRYADAIVFNA